MIQARHTPAFVNQYGSVVAGDENELEIAAWHQPMPASR
jgi:hypothetical protein